MVSEVKFGARQAVRATMLFLDIMSIISSLKNLLKLTYNNYMNVCHWKMNAQNSNEIYLKIVSIPIHNLFS